MLLHNRATATAWASVIRLPSVKWGTAKRTNAKFCAKVYVPNRHISRSFFFFTILLFLLYAFVFYFLKWYHMGENIPNDISTESMQQITPKNHVYI